MDIIWFERDFGLYPFTFHSYNIRVYVVLDGSTISLCFDNPALRWLTCTPVCCSVRKGVLGEEKGRSGRPPTLRYESTQKGDNNTKEEDHRAH